MDKHLQGDNLLLALKTRAGDLQAQASANGAPMKRSAALEAAAREQGFRDWNAAAAAGKASPVPPAPQPHFLWRSIERGLPPLPIRLFQRESRFHDSIQELMRRANQYELIATKVPKEARREMLGIIGGPLPYVFEQSRSRWGDDLYRLCDRGYDPWKGIVFTREELTEAGVDEWNEEYGTHGGSDAFSVASDEVALTSDAEKLKRLARLLAGIALVADAAYDRQLGEVVPNGSGFEIDLNDPAQFTAPNVARLLGSRDDSEHRQLRVTKAGVAYLSDVVGNKEIDGLAFRLETWARGNGYVGIDAAQDPEWVNTVLTMLRKHWPNPQARLVDW